MTRGSQVAALVAALLLAVPVVSALASGQPGFLFPSVSTHHPGDRLVVRWQGSRARVTARLTLYGPFASVNGLKRNPHVHQVAVSKAVHGVNAHRQVVLTIVVPRHAKRGFYDLRAAATVKSGNSTSTSGGDEVLRVVPAEHVPTVHPGG